MKGEWFFLLGILLSVLFIPLIFAQVNSSNYGINSFVVGGGGNDVSSTNYNLGAIVGLISGIVNSSNYINNFGFFIGDVSNSAPNNPVVNLVSLDGTNRTNTNLNCSALITDDDSGDLLNVTVNWYKEDTLNFSLDYNDDYVNASMFSAILDLGNTTKGDNWSCGLRLYDGNLYSGWVNSSKLEILNTLPNVTLVSPNDGNETTNRTPTFIWSSSDVDLDSLIYELNITLNASSLCVDSGRGATGISQENYTHESYLKCLWDNGDSYIWSVRASDDAQVSYGDWSSSWSIKFNSLVSISLPNNSIEFGLIARGVSDDTTDDNPNPFLLQNDGNVFTNITVNATSLWESVSNPSLYFQYKVDNKTSEEGSFNWGLSQISWANMSGGITGMAIVEFDWNDSVDTVEVDINITVPSGEGAGERDSIVYFISSLAE